MSWSCWNEAAGGRTLFARVFVLRGRGVHGLQAVHPAGVVQVGPQLAGDGGVGGGLEI